MGLFAKYKTQGSAETSTGPTIRTEKTIRIKTPDSRREPAKPAVYVEAPANGKHSQIQQSVKKPQPVRIARKPAPHRPVLASDSSDDAAPDHRPSKRRRISGETGEAAVPGPRRDLWAAAPAANGSSSAVDQLTPAFTPACSLASSSKPKAYSQVFFGAEQPTTVTLQYPGLDEGEVYELVQPMSKEDFNPFDEIIHNMRCMALYFFPSESEKKLVLDEDSELTDDLGIVRRLRRSSFIRNLTDYRASLSAFNELLGRLRQDGSIQRTVGAMHRPPLALIERILTQVYSRTVSLEVEKLRAYENGTDFVYGELLTGFVSAIFRETDLRSDQVLVDLGSGVGNVVLQAALELGCDSWGCEIMAKASELAEAQRREFYARCRLWGLRPGTAHLRSADFLSDPDTGRALRRAAVVLVNNQAFTPALNDGLVNLFLDLPEGCRIVSLKPFVTPEHRISKRNYNSPLNLLRVTKRYYGSDSVSWTSAPGEYYISVKDTSMLKRFAKANGLTTVEATAAHVKPPQSAED